jgi:uncharacterized protein (DUF362 family)
VGVKKPIDRREFLLQSLRLGVSLSLAGAASAEIRGASPRSGRETVDIAAVAGDDFAACASAAVELVGGMEKFVPKHSRVALLPNVQSSHPGTFTNPEVVRAAIRLCRRAGAAEISLLSWQAMKNWESTGLARVAADEGAELKLFSREETNFRPVPVPKGKALTEARLLNALFDHDVLIDMPVTKDHAGNKFTGTMKNLMALNSPASNRSFHQEKWQTDPGAIEYLDQCIADLNTVVKPALCLVDATEFITTNGPFGPGELLKPKKVVAGVDRVAVDSYCASLWGLKAEDIFMIRHGHEHGLGEMRLSGVNIKQSTV